LDLEAFGRDGAIKLPGLMRESLDELIRLETDGPGARLRRSGLIELIAPTTAAVRSLIGERAKPVRAVLFDKTAEDNWALAWHQDRTIVVRERRDVAGFGPWSLKQGLLHVAPPFEILARMATLRVHIDAVGRENAPLKVALGSHRAGPVGATEAAARAGQHAELICLAGPGDVWAYVTPILHASDRAARPGRRRVLQVDYSADDLPGGLQWAGLEP
jgi:hypothetical protein